MKVKELKKILGSLDENLEVVMASDAEGNSYSSMNGYNVMIYDTLYGEVGLPKLTEELVDAGYGEEDVMSPTPSRIHALILYGD